MHDRSAAPVATTLRRALDNRRPNESPFLQTLGEKTQAGAVPGQNLQPVRPFRAEDENRPGERIALKLFFRQPRQAVGAASEVDRLRRHQNPNARRNRDHVAAFTARSTFVSVATSIPGLTRTTAAPSAISIVAHGIAQEAAADGAGASTITCAKLTLPAAVEAPRRRTTRRCALRRQPNSCCGVSPCRRATAETLSPLS